MKNKILKIILDKKFIIPIYILFAVIASIQPLVSGLKTYSDGGPEYAKYNNYVIFEKSYDHLRNNQDLYVLYPDEHWDLYKYTPTFSVFFGFFNIFPDWIGLNLWNLLNAFILLISIYYLPRLTDKQRGGILLIILLELLGSMQNGQSNALIAGLLVLSFGFMEKGKPLFASFCIVFSAFIKLFGIIGLVLLLFYPKKWKSVLYSLMWFSILLALPLIFINLDQYEYLFNSYQRMLKNDHSTSYGLSVMGWLHSWFSTNINNIYVVLFGCAIFLLPFLKIKTYKEFDFRYLGLASLLLWIVIFNHKAESPTFIIAMTGVALWFIKSRKNWLNITLFVSAFILTSLSPTDFFPKFLRKEFVDPYTLKVFPCILIWLKIIYDMLTMKTSIKIPHIHKIQV